MFGKKKDEKKEGEKSIDEEQKKLEEMAASGDSKADDSGLEGLKNIGSATDGNPEEKPAEEAKPEENLVDAPAEEPKPEPVSEPEPQPQEEPAEETPKKKKKTSKSEAEKLKKQIETQKQTMRELEKEKDDALHKGDELAELIEDMTGEMRDIEKKPPQESAPASAQVMPDMAPQLKALEEKTSAQMQTLQETIKAIAEQKQTQKQDEEEVAVTMKKMFDKRLKDLSDKLEEAKVKPALGGDGSPGSDASGGLMAMGGGVDFKKEVDSFKKSLKDIATLLDAFKEEAEDRFMSIDREMEVLNTIPELEQKMKMFEKKLGPENVDKLRMLISTADDLKDEVIPLVVKRETEEKIDPFSKRVKKVEEMNDRISDKFGEILLEIKSLSKLDNRIVRLEDNHTELKKAIADFRESSGEKEKERKSELTDRLKDVIPKMLESESNNLRKDFSGRFAFIDDKLQSLENMITENRNDIAELSALKGEFGVIDDRMDTIDESSEKFVERMDALKGKIDALRENVEKLETPKEIITELDNKTKDILEIREFFVRRSDGLEERINQLDERATPTKELHDKVDNIFKNLADLRENQKVLEQKFDAEKKELQKIIFQNAEEKKKLEDKLKEQKMRVSTLLKEFK
ncbi:MAG: hypothetical protein JW789_01655 [Candidatus Aenigmarchaeota archaeon]|nr:hypothetical protein [Candidatus Aenigmarchaeota archaeon]